MLVLVKAPEIHCRGTPNLTKSELYDLNPFPFFFFFFPAPTQMMTGDTRQICALSRHRYVGILADFMELDHTETHTYIC